MARFCQTLGAFLSVPKPSWGSHTECFGLMRLVRLRLHRKEQSGLQDSPGAMVKRVREYGHGSTLHLGSSATSWRLGEDVMEAALSYHLAQCESCY